MITASAVQHLSRDQRNHIRYSPATETGLARKFGVSVKTVRLVRKTAQPQHPARIAALIRRDLRCVDVINTHGGVVSRSIVPAAAVRRPKKNTFKG